MKKTPLIFFIIVIITCPVIASSAPITTGYLKPSPQNISISELEKHIENHPGEPEIFKTTYKKHGFIEVYKYPAAGKSYCGKDASPSVPCAYEHILIFNYCTERYRCPEHDASSLYIPVKLGVLGKIISINEMDELQADNFPLNSNNGRAFWDDSFVITVQNFSDEYLSKRPAQPKKTAKYAIKPLMDDKQLCYLEWDILKQITDWQQVIDAYMSFVQNPSEKLAILAWDYLDSISETNDSEQQRAYKKIQENFTPLLKRIEPNKTGSIGLATKLVEVMDIADTKELQLALGALITKAPERFVKIFPSYRPKFDQEKQKSIIRELGPEFNTVDKQCAELQARIDALQDLPDKKFKVSTKWRKTMPLGILNNRFNKLCSADGKITEVGGIPKGSIVQFSSLFPKFSLPGTVVGKNPGYILTSLGTIKLDKVFSFSFTIDIPGEDNPHYKSLKRNDDYGIALVKTSPIEGSRLKLGDSSLLKAGDPLKVVTLDKEKNIKIIEGKTGERFCFELPCKGDYEFIQTGVWVADKDVFGGPILNSRNEIVGLVTILHRPQDGFTMQAIGVPVNIIKKTFPQIKVSQK